MLRHQRVGRPSGLVAQISAGEAGARGSFDAYFGTDSLLPSWNTTISGLNLVEYLPSSRLQTARCVSMNSL